MSDTTTITVVAGDGEETLNPVTATVTVLGTVPNGPPGADGTGIPDGGTTGQVLSKQSDADGDADWDDPTGGSGAVDSVNGETGVVVLSAADVGADPAGTATSAVATHAGLADPHPGYLTPAEGNAAYDALGAAAAEAVLARNADNLTSGTVADARIASTLARDSEVTAAVAAEATLARNADNLTSGTVADARVASTIARDSEVTAAVAAEATLARNADNLTSGTVADARIASTIARDSEVATAVSDHAAAANPHPAYLTEAEGDAAYEPTGAVRSVVAGANVTVDATDPQNPIVASTGGGSGLPPQWTQDDLTGAVIAEVDDIAETPITIQAFAGQTAPLLVLKDENGVTVGTIDPSGNFHLTPSDPLHNDYFLIEGAVGSSANDTDLFRIVGDVDGEIVMTANGGFTAREGADGSDGIVLLSHGNRLHLGDFGASNEVSLTLAAPSPGFGIDASAVARITRWTTLGDFILQGTHAPPDDATLANGECGIWYDDTAGAPTVHLKAKDAVGALFTATIPMTAV